ncbi:MAG: hypothetical protein COW01_06205 [Bdellovibrionales bacterium CG12_big_fil_rev_8_21_14_0_65_38_15]|nr:MAG: hypothetical protein COW79_04100 [Bdellovibrionales bacterium CG22_combo_CG10-13_8_21_14_all_38_13]PIQ56020.1 MAG: hypothetical protein COW01_06205 [Bdellovibrionales bacterium CG12_big_fil_rev_8_21_14_0_65_38_15]PIR30625.1 MAG: hypothetical protein COV38_04745 [Bdellovibrionales bacterium CG11_big_fil_rev_8_21_14_0_20_38_13]
MKKILFAAAFSLSLTGSAMAAHGPAGCGLGSMLFQGKSGLVFNVLAATFNGSSGNQTFGMSTGTLGCEDAQSAKVSVVSFVEGNKIALSNDISRGQGETLDAYLELIGQKNVDKSVLQKSYPTIFTKEASAEQIHTNILVALNK